MNMISFISSWLKDIVVLFVLITIAELIMPNGNMKKYINLVIGLLIIVTIINPFIRLFKLDFSLDKAVMNYSKNGKLEGDDNEEFYSQQNNQIEKVYKERIRNELAKLIEDETNYKVLDITVSLLDDQKRYGELDKLNILITEKDKEDVNNRILIKKIETVDLVSNLENNSSTNDEYDEIKEIIYNNYSVDKEKIIIRTNKKGIGE